MSSSFETAVNAMYRHIKKKGVTVFFDMEDSQLAKMGALYSYDSKSKELRISVPELKARDKKLLFKFIRHIHDNGGLLWKDSKAKALEEYVEYSSENKNKEVLDFFSSVLSPDDFSALKMALFLKDQSEKGARIGAYKLDIRERFGDRGNNIANLCSAGYFEDELRNLYMNIPTSEFNEYYEMVVGDGARALFVHRNMTVSNIAKEVDKMVAKAIKYHMQDFRLHGKGTSNVQVISDFVKSRTGKEGYTVSQKFRNQKIDAIEYIIKINR